jgi:hypothetical protein
MRVFVTNTNNSFSQTINASDYRQMAGTPDDLLAFAAVFFGAWSTGNLDEASLEQYRARVEVLAHSGVDGSPSIVRLSPYEFRLVQPTGQESIFEAVTLDDALDAIGKAEERTAAALCFIQKLRQAVEDGNALSAFNVARDIRREFGTGNGDFSLPTGFGWDAMMKDIENGQGRLRVPDEDEEPGIEDREFEEGDIDRAADSGLWNEDAGEF